jgi:hypothetical protein
VHDLATATAPLPRASGGIGPAADPFLVEMLEAGGLIKPATARPEIFS